MYEAKTPLKKLETEKERTEKAAIMATLREAFVVLVKEMHRDTSPQEDISCDRASLQELQSNCRSVGERIGLMWERGDAVTPIAVLELVRILKREEGIKQTGSVDGEEEKAELPHEPEKLPELFRRLLYEKLSLITTDAIKRLSETIDAVKKISGVNEKIYVKNDFEAWVQERIGVLQEMIRTKPYNRGTREALTSRLKALDHIHGGTVLEADKDLVLMALVEDMHERAKDAKRALVQWLTLQKTQDAYGKLAVALEELFKREQFFVFVQ